MNLADELIKIRKLLDDGAISQEEYEKLKKTLIDGTSAQSQMQPKPMPKIKLDEKAKKNLSWIVGIFFISSAIMSVIRTPFASIFMLLAGAVLLPPVKEKLMSKYNISKKVYIRLTAAVIILFSLVCSLELSSVENKEIVAEFNEKRDDIISKAIAAIEKNDYEEAVSLYEKYKVVSDKELERLGNLAQKEYDKQVKRDNELRSQFSTWNGAHINLEKAIKKSMHDPKSYEHVETLYWDKGSYLIVKTTFRGKNPFGGVVVNNTRAKVDMDGNILEILD